MPFTLAHPAAILPMSGNKRWSVTALILGSMVPDFEFFFHLREVENIGHHWYGIVLFDLPVTVILCYIFHVLLRNPFISNLPSYLKSRFVTYTRFDWTSYAKENKRRIVLSSFIGILTHLVWDGFTHHDGLFVELFPFLSRVISIQNFHIPVYYFLQILFSILGMMVMFIAIYRMPTGKMDFSHVQKNYLYWPFFLCTVSVILLIRLIGWPQYNSFWGVFMAVMGSIYYSWIASSILFKNLLLKTTKIR